MADQLEDVILSKRGPRLRDDAGKPVTDEQGVPQFGPPIPTKTVRIKNLTAGEAMDAADFAQALSPIGQPTRENSLRVFALCSVREIGDENGRNFRTIMRPVGPDALREIRELRDQFTPDELEQLTLGSLTFTNKLNEDDDPKDSPLEKPSDGSPTLNS